jgi:hypothetical protein
MTTDRRSHATSADEPNFHGRFSDLALTPGSDLRHASIDSEIHAGDEGAFIGGEKRDGSRDFFWLAPATHWDL